MPSASYTGNLGFSSDTCISGASWTFYLIKAIHEVEILAEIGVILLLFTIGIEFSLKQFFQIKKTLLLGGSVQVLLTSLAGLRIAKLSSLFGE